MAVSRRGFIEAGVQTALVLTAGRGLLAQQVPRAETRRGGSGPIGIKLGDFFAGWIDGFEGGEISSSVHSLSDLKEHNPNPNQSTVGDVLLTLGAGGSKVLDDFLKQSFSSSEVSRTDLAIGNISNDNVDVTEYKRAALVKIQFSKMEVTQPVRLIMTFRAASGTKREEAASSWLKLFSDEVKQKSFESGFRLSITGLDCSRVRLIDALSTSRVVTDQQLAGEGPFAATPWSPVALGFVSPVDDLPAFEAWQRNALSGTPDLRDGTIDYAPGDLNGRNTNTPPHYRLRLQELMPTVVVRERVQAGAAPTVRVQALARGRVTLEGFELIGA